MNKKLGCRPRDRYPSITFVMTHELKDCLIQQAAKETLREAAKEYLARHKNEGEN